MTEPTPRSVDGFGPEDMAIPELKLIQNTGGDYAKEVLGAKPGDFFITVAEEVIPADQGLQLVIVDVRKARTYWGREEIGEDPPACSSIDGILALDGTECVTCEHKHDAPWLLSKAEKRDKCLLNYNLIAIDMERNLPLFVRVHGISCTSVKEIVTRIKWNQELQEKGQTQWHKAPVMVSSVKKKTAAGEAFMFKFILGKELIPDEPAKEYLIKSGQLLGTVLALPVGEELEPEPFPVGEEEAEPEPEPTAETKHPAPEARPAQAKAMAKVVSPQKPAIIDTEF